MAAESQQGGEVQVDASLVNPGKFQPYDPMTPYQAPAMPNPQPAMPSPLPQQGPEINGAVKQSGAIATVADSILRGFMQGRAYHQAKEVMQLKKKTDDLQNSYNQDAVRLYQLTQAGVSSTSDEYKAAKSSVDGSWGALMDFYGGHIQQMTGDKKGKGKKNQQQLPPQAVLTNPASTPYEKAQAWYQVSKQAGPPVYGRIAMLNTPEAKQARANQAAMPGLEAGRISHEQTVQAAQGTIDKLGPEIAKFSSTPQSQWTDAQKQQHSEYRQAYDVVSPPKIEEPKPGDETKMALDEVVKRISQPGYKLTDADKEIFRANKIDVEPKSKLHITSRGEIIAEHEDGSFEVKRGVQGAYETRGGRGGGGGGRGGGSSEDKVYNKWNAYYKEHYPDMDADAREALVRRKVEGAGQQQAGAIAHDAIQEPKQFDNDVISAAVDRMRSLPQYKDMKTLDEALANIVGQGENGYQYHSKDDLGEPDSKGKYAGNVDEAGLKDIERDLQTQIRAVMSGSKETALSPSARRAATRRMWPVFGPAAAPAGGGASPGSPQAAAAPSAAPASSPASHGGHFEVQTPGGTFRFKTKKAADDFRREAGVLKRGGKM